VAKRREPIVASFLEQWLSAIENTVRPSTFSGYRAHVRLHLVPHLGKMPLSKVDAPALNAMYAALSANGSATGGSLSVATVRRAHATIHRALRDAVRWGLLTDNPADRCDPPRLRVGLEMTTWTAEELRLFLQFARDDELYPLWFVLATTGMRRGEALGLRWSDVDLDNAQLAVRQTIVEVGGQVLVSSPKTARGRRVVALDKSTVEVLEDCARGYEKALIFCKADGRPLRPSVVSRRFNTLVAKVDLPRIRLHDLRHTHATLALQAGVHPKIVSERLGHATIAFTLDVYSHALHHMQRDAAERIGELLFGDQ
jgi:integrase